MNLEYIIDGQSIRNRIRVRKRINKIYNLHMLRSLLEITGNMTLDILTVKLAR